MSNPNNPGATPPGAEPDTTMIRSGSGSAEDRPVGTRADRVREWARRNSPARPQSAAGDDGTAGQSAVSPVSGTESPAMPTDAQADAPTQGGFFTKVRERARTVSAGMAGAAAGAMGDDKAQTGTVATAVPPPDGGDDAGDRRPGTARRTRKARLRLAQVDPWSVMKTAFLFSIAAGIILWVATGTVWAVISSSGMFGEINRMVGDIIQTPGDDTPFRIQDYISTSKVMGTAALIAVIDVVIFTALATLGAFLYNLASAMIGGLEVTLAED